MTSPQATNRRRTYSLLSRSSRGSINRGGADVHPYNGTGDSANASGLSRTDSFRANNNADITATSSDGPSSTQQVAQNAEEEAKLRGELRYFFMTPCEKWRYRRKIPFNLSIQLLKVLLVTTLIIVFGNYRAAYVSYQSTLQVTLEHLYLYNWNPAYETPPYPPSSGVYAVYTQQDFYASVDHAVSQYNTTQLFETDTLQLFREKNSSKILPPHFCVKQYRDAYVSAWNRTIRANFDLYEWCVPVRPVAVFNESTNTTDMVYDIRRFLAAERNLTGLPFEAIDHVHVRFAFVSLKPPVTELVSWATDCYLLNVTIVFDNTDRSGQIPLSLNLLVSAIECPMPVDSDDHSLSALNYVISVLVIVFCAVSFVLCLRSLCRGYRLMRTTARHFAGVLGQPLALADRFEFANLWFVMVVCSDVMAIWACAMKMRIDAHASDAYDVCSAILGISGLLIWFGVLRYLTFFAGYSDLILTMKRAAPNMVRYLICAVTMFLGFLFCGWVVIGPYHFKMRTLSSTAECLFSLVNGDDMFATFSNLSMDVASMYVYVFLRIYLLCFISMFIYMVLAVFLSVILDVYDTVKQTGASTLRQTQSESSDLFKFIYRLDDDDSIAVKQREGRARVNSATRSQLVNGTSINATLPSDEYSSLAGNRERGCLLSRCCCCVPTADAYPDVS